MEFIPEQRCTLPSFNSEQHPSKQITRINLNGRHELEIYTTGGLGSKSALVGMHGNGVV
jgi:hypothetical protein